MFEMFVIGPVATSGLRLVRRCMDCQAAHSLKDETCHGFGPRCLAPQRPAPDGDELAAELPLL